jgi:hypothetical protein
VFPLPLYVLTLADPCGSVKGSFDDPAIGDVSGHFALDGLGGAAIASLVGRESLRPVFIVETGGVHPVTVGARSLDVVQNFPDGDQFAEVSLRHDVCPLPLLWSENSKPLQSCQDAEVCLTVLQRPKAGNLCRHRPGGILACCGLVCQTLGRSGRGALAGLLRDGGGLDSLRLGEVGEEGQDADGPEGIDVFGAPAARGSLDDVMAPPDVHDGAREEEVLDEPPDGHLDAGSFVVKTGGSGDAADRMALDESRRDGGGLAAADGLGGGGGDLDGAAGGGAHDGVLRVFVLFVAGDV